MEEAARVSVVIPVFNGAEHLAEAITSARDQTLPAYEILVFDNASTDASRDIALELLPESAVATSERNAGAVANFNRAARAASGDFVLWLAADDRLAPRHLEVCAEALERRPRAPACLPGIRFISPTGDVLRDHTDSALASPDPGIRLRAFLRRPRWTEFYCLYRRDRLLASPMMTPEYGADVLLTWWFLLRGPLATVEEPLLDYREYEQKTVAEMAASLDPHAPTMHWRKARMWRRLRAMTNDEGVDAQTARTARRELTRCLADSTWMLHAAEDVILRWPRAATFGAPAVRAVRSGRRRATRRRAPTPGHDGPWDTSTGP